jgi:hypothetical protein
MQMIYPSICEIYDAVLALLAVCLSRRESVARLETERCALGGLVESFMFPMLLSVEARGV